MIRDACTASVRNDSSQVCRLKASLFVGKISKTIIIDIAFVDNGKLCGQQATLCTMDNTVDNG